VRAAIQRRRADRWPPPSPISEDGRLAGLTTTGCVALSAAVWLVVAFHVSQCTRHCTVEPGVGGLVAMMVAVVLVAAVALGWVVLGRPTDPDPGAGTGWVVGLSVIFSLGVIAGASGIPSLSCPAGTTLSFFGFCAGPGGTRSPAAEWAWLRHIIDVVGLAIGFTIIRSRRWVDVSAPIAATVWLGGTGALLARTLLRS
jgi:hypothetical protein